MSTLTDEQLLDIWIHDRTNNEKHDCVSYARAVIAAYKATLPEPKGEPVFWYRPTSAGGYEGPIHNQSIEDVRKKSGAWKPLYASPTIPEDFRLVSLEVCEAFDRLERACYELDYHAEEYDFDDGVGMGASQWLWKDLTFALDVVSDAKNEAAKEVQS